MTPKILKLVDAIKAGQPITAADAAALADAFKAAEADRLAADKVAESLKVIEVSLKTALISALRTLQVDGVQGKQFAVSLKQVDEPTVGDWDAFYKYILKTKDFSLLERRPGKGAIKERWEDGKQVPGINKFPVDKLSFTKVK